MTKKDETIKRKNKLNCFFYENGRCQKIFINCFGSSNCKYYMDKSCELKNKPIKVNSEKSEIDLSNMKRKRIVKAKYEPSLITLKSGFLQGDFKIKYLETNKMVEHTIDKTIDRDTELVREIVKHKKGDIIVINEENIKIIWENLYLKK